MSRSGMAITTLAVTLWCACAPRPTADEPAPSNATIGQAARTVEQFITDTMRILGAPGASICVVRDGQVVWSHAFGFADLEQEVPATAETRFRIGSVSKSLTSVAIGRLVQDGQLLVALLLGLPNAPLDVADRIEVLRQLGAIART